MILSEAIKKFIVMKKASGLKYEHEQRVFRQFCSIAGDVELHDMSEAITSAYIFSENTSEQSIAKRYFPLRLFFRWCIDRGYMKHMPIRYNCPHPHSDFIPYIYSKDEIRRILHEALACGSVSSPFLGETVQALLLTIYSCGLRLGEAISIRICDIDFHKHEMLIRESKFKKSRILPFCEQLSEFLNCFMKNRRYCMALPEQEESAFFCSRTGNKLYGPQIDHLFQRIRRNAQINPTNRKQSPRIHDLRHSFAVHQLYDWYKNGLPVNELLPGLSTYLGHKDLEDTKIYLTMTPELLQLVSEKFEKHTFTR